MAPSYTLLLNNLKKTLKSKELKNQFVQEIQTPHKFPFRFNLTWHYLIGQV